ncbi:MAG TPA: MFS transporter [Verrucomicrobiota bacterium]|nr:MFS transporter [Verrucomicrobiota bacterium]HNU51025.1 MFS transporter [Verrucomicrobiota bacterium]
MDVPTSASGGPRPAPPDQAGEQAVLAKVTWRLLPLLLLCYIIAYIDRINVGFAKLHLQQVLGVDPATFGRVYGMGAGLFFIGYFLFEVPSNLILHRVGARIWIARIMVLWGFISMGMMFIHNTTVFYCMRFLLGAAEAGFFPGVILYLTYWFPARERARAVALFATGGVIAGIVGSPISGLILGMNGLAGLAGWQWLFLIEGIPAVLLGLIVLIVLPKGPRHARWLTSSECAWLESRIAAEETGSGQARRHRLAEAFTSRRVWLLCLLYFLLNVGGYGYEMWLPSIVKDFSKSSDAAVGFLNALPYLAAAVAMVAVGRYSDRTGHRRWPVALGAGVSAVGFALSGWLQSPYLAIAALILAFVGLKSTLGPFWALGTTFLSGTAAAGGIALINSVGNLGGFAGPYLVGVIKDLTGSNLAALLMLGGALLAMGLLALAIPEPRQSAAPAVTLKPEPS